MEKLSLGEFLSVLRKGKGLKQEDVADKLGVSAKTISSWENNRTYPDIVMLPIIADLFGVTVDELVRGAKSNNASKEPEVLDNKNITKIRKVKYAKYKESNLYFTISLILNSLISVLGIYLMCFIATWTLVFAVFGFIGFVASLVVLIQNEHRYLQNEGILTQEDFVEDNYLTIVTCKLNTLKCIVPGFIPYLIYGIVINVIHGLHPKAFVKQVGDIYLDPTSGILTFAIISLVLGLLGIIICFILYIINSKKYGNEQGKIKSRKNLKLSIILASIMCGTMILCPVTTAICDKTGPVYDYINEKYVYDSSEELLNAMNTFRVDSQELLDASLTMDQEILFDYSKLDYYSFQKIVDLSNGFFYLDGFTIDFNFVYLYEKDPELGEYFCVDEVAHLIKDAYFEANNKDNFSVHYEKYDDITFNVPNELIYFDYDFTNKVYYLNFVLGTYAINENYKLVVDGSKKYTEFYDGLYYRNNENLIIEEWIECYCNETYVLYYEDAYDDPDLSYISNKWVPMFTNQMYSNISYTTTRDYNTKDYSERIGYIICGENKGKFGYYGYSYHYRSENNLLIETTAFLIVLGLGLAAGLIFWKKEKYEINFKVNKEKRDNNE